MAINNTCFSSTVCYNSGVRVKVCNFFVLAGPSGVGKTTLIKRLLEAKPDEVVHPLTETTREKRPGEADGREMIFLSHDLFAPRLLGNEYLAHTEYDGHFYGTRKAHIVDALRAGKKVVVAFDKGGIHCLRHQGFPAVCIYLVAPSPLRLGKWLEERWPDKGPAYEARLAQATNEFEEFERDREWRGMFDYFLFSDDMNQMVADTLTIMGF